MSAEPTGTSDREARRQEVLHRVAQVLEAESLADPEGGLDTIEVVDFDGDDVLQVRLKDTCQSCPASLITLTMSLERTLKASIPEIRFVEAVL